MPTKTIAPCLRRLVALALLATLGLPAALAQQTDAALDTVRAGRFDQGKMWTFDNPPVEYFRATYDFSPDEAWFERARLGALRIPGCSASFVSPNGLVMTNHHCGRGHATAVEREGEDILNEGFYAPSLAEERGVEGLYADQLIAITDVTAEVDAALDGAETDAERAAAREEAIARIADRMAEEAGGEEAGVFVQVVALYHGGQYSAYTFRRYGDVHLVFIPELQLGYYGGDADNFTYPRYALDMAFFRVYQDGEPLSTPNYFPWSEDGSREGEAVFVVGNPGATYRLETVAQLEYRRDVSEQAVLDLVNTRLDALYAFLEEDPETAREMDLMNTIFGLENTRKLYEGRLRALRDPYIMARRRDTERAFREAIEQDMALREAYGTLIDEIAAVQRERRALAPESGAFLAFSSSGLASATQRRARLAYAYLARQESGAAEGDLAELREQLLAVDDQPLGLESRLLTARLQDFVTYFGADSPVAAEILKGRTPEAAAAQILSGTVLRTREQTAQALEAGTLAATDPAVKMVDAFIDRYRDAQSGTAGLMARQQDLAGRLGRARFAVYGTDVPPDATFSLRIADGVVDGYAYNGTLAPPYTTFYGLYDHYYAYGEDSEWDLPARWIDPPETFDLSTPVNLVATADIIGGNSGSPLLNKDLEVVGLIFDGNIESLSGDYIYLTDRARSVAVDSRGILEALDDIYDADRMVLEIRSGRLVSTEEEADAVRGGAP